MHPACWFTGLVILPSLALGHWVSSYLVSLRGIRRIESFPVWRHQLTPGNVLAEEDGTAVSLKDFSAEADLLVAPVMDG